MLRIGASYVRNTNRVGAFEPLDISPISSGRKGAWDWVQCMANDWINHTPIMKLQQKFRSPHLGELPDWWYTCMCQEHDASWGHWSVLCCCRCPRWFSPKFRIHVISSFFSMLILFDSFSSSYLIVLLRKFSKAVFSMQLLPFHHTLLFFFYHKKKLELGVVKGTPSVIEYWTHNACVPCTPGSACLGASPGMRNLAESFCLPCKFQITV